MHRNEGWLEPLLDPIARNANTTTVPIIEPIDHDTFSVYNTPIDALELGGFDWDLAFYWLTVSEADARRRVNKTDPVRSPIMAGMAINVQVRHSFTRSFSTKLIFNRTKMLDRWPVRHKPRLLPVAGLVRSRHGDLGRREPRSVVQNLDVRRPAGVRALQPRGSRVPHEQSVQDDDVEPRRRHQRHSLRLGHRLLALQLDPAGRSVAGRVQGALLRTRSLRRSRRPHHQRERPSGAAPKASVQELRLVSHERLSRLGGARSISALWGGT